MKASELRIGNFVQLNTNITQVDVIDYNQIIATEFGLIELKYIKPIQLTEELLIKFGGILDYEDDSYVFGNFAVSVNKKSEAIMFFKDEQISEFNYVHQLQNLYFALTGEELILKQLQND